MAIECKITSYNNKTVVFPFEHECIAIALPVAYKKLFLLETLEPINAFPLPLYAFRYDDKAIQKTIIAILHTAFICKNLLAPGNDLGDLRNICCDIKLKFRFQCTKLQ